MSDSSSADTSSSKDSAPLAIIKRNDFPPWSRADSDFPPQLVHHALGHDRKKRCTAAPRRSTTASEPRSPSHVESLSIRMSGEIQVTRQRAAENQTALDRDDSSRTVDSWRSRARIVEPEAAASAITSSSSLVLTCARHQLRRKRLLGPICSPRQSGLM